MKPGSVKEQVDNICGPLVSVASIHLRPCSTTAAINNMETDELYSKKASFMDTEI